MKEITVISRIEKIIDTMNYKTAYIEIQTETNKYILEKENKRTIGFKSDNR